MEELPKKPRCTVAAVREYGEVASHRLTEMKGEERQKQIDVCERERERGGESEGEV